MNYYNREIPKPFNNLPKSSLNEHKDKTIEACSINKPNGQSCSKSGMGGFGTILMLLVALDII